MSARAPCDFAVKNYRNTGGVHGETRRLPMVDRLFARKSGP